MLHRPYLLVCLGLLLAGLAGGCGSSTSSPAPPSAVERQLQAVGDAYLRATVRLHKPPQNLEELRPSLQEHGDPDTLLLSPDDKQPFAIVWGVELRRLKARGGDLPVVAYERQGQNGVRHVLRGRSDVVRLNTSQLKSARFPDGYTFPF